jgi:hypothetical protein
VFGQQGFVGRHNRFAGSQSGLHGDLGRPIGTTDEFNEKVVFGRGG